MSLYLSFMIWQWIFMQVYIFENTIEQVKNYFTFFICEQENSCHLKDVVFHA